MTELIDSNDAQLYQDAFASLRAEFETNEEIPSGDDADETLETGEEETPPEGEQTSDEEDSIEVAGQKLTLADIEELVRLKSFIDGDTQASLESTRATVEQSRQQAATVPPAPAWTPPSPPEGLDLDDPGIKALWDQQVQLATQLEFQRQESFRRMQTETVADVERAVADWNKKYKLDDSILSTLRSKAADSGVAATLSSAGRSVYDSTASALESAFWSDPTLRSQYLVAAEAANKQSATAQRNKQNKLSALGGKGSSASKTKPAAEMTAEQRRQGMIAELTEHLSRT